MTNLEMVLGKEITEEEIKNACSMAKVSYNKVNIVIENFNSEDGFDVPSIISKMYKNTNSTKAIKVTEILVTMSGIYNQISVSSEEELSECNKLIGDAMKQSEVKGLDDLYDILNGKKENKGGRKMDLSGIIENNNSGENYVEKIVDENKGGKKHMKVTIESTEEKMLNMIEDMYDEEQQAKEDKKNDENISNDENSEKVVDAEEVVEETQEESSEDKNKNGSKNNPLDINSSEFKAKVEEIKKLANLKQHNVLEAKGLILETIGDIEDMEYLSEDEDLQKLSQELIDGPFSDYIIYTQLYNENIISELPSASKLINASVGLVEGILIKSLNNDGFKISKIDDEYLEDVKGVFERRFEASMKGDIEYCDNNEFELSDLMRQICSYIKVDYEPDESEKTESQKANEAIYKLINKLRVEAGLTPIKF